VEQSCRFALISCVSGSGNGQGEQRGKAVDFHGMVVKWF
jgi:hypothetical protein